MLVIPWINIVIISLIILIRIIISISTNSPLPIWYSIELNTSAIIPILAITNKKDKGVAIKYQIINSFAALIFIFSRLNLELFPINEINFQVLSLLIISSIIIKLGIFPFIFWFISVIKNINWYAIFIITTIQKIIPIVILIWIEKNLNNSILLILICFNATIAAIGTLTSNSIKIIIAFSSIRYSRWLILIIVNNPVIWRVSIFIYSINIIFTTKIINLKKILFLNKPSKEKNINLAIIIINLGGLPPIAGFAIKIIILKHILSTCSFIIVLARIILILSTLIILFTYIKIIIRSIIKNSINLIWIKKKDNKSIKLIFNIIITLPIIIIW